MLLTAVFPICDLRPLLGSEPPGTVGPYWPRPDIAVDFVPWFGAIRPGGSNARVRGNRVCRARNALRLRALRLAGPSGDETAGPFRAVFRDLTADGCVLVRYDLALGSHPDSRRELPPLRLLAERFADLPVEIPEQRQGEEIELRYAGNFLARAYLEATTPAKQRPQLAPDWIVAGDPVLFVQWSAAERISEDGIPDLERVAGGALSVGRAPMLATGLRAATWYIRHAADRDSARLATQLRVDVADLCVRRECLRTVLEHVASGRIAPPRNPREARARQRATLSESDVLQSYLGDAVREIDRRQRGVPVSTAQVVAPALVPCGDRTPDGASSPGGAPAIEAGGARRPDQTRDQAPSFVTALEGALRRLDVRGNIRRNVTTWAQRDWNEPAIEPARVTQVAANGGPSTANDQAQRPRREPPPTAASRDEPRAIDGAPPPARDVTAHARLAAVGRDRIDPGETAEFCLELKIDAPLSRPGPASDLTTFPLAFAQGVTERRLVARVSSRDFCRPPDESWETTFRVRRDGTTPSSWSFLAQAYGDKPRYELTVQLLVDNLPVPMLEVTLPRRGAGQAAEPTAAVRFSCAAVPGADLVITIDHEGAVLVVKWTPLAHEIGRWPIHFDPAQHWKTLGVNRYQQREALHDYCCRLATDLDGDLFKVLKQHAEAGHTVLVMSEAPMLPFELVPLGRTAPFLGTRCPVARWVNRPDVPLPAARPRPVGQVACIRPEYEEGRKLKWAADEEARLAERFPGLLHAHDRAEVDALLNRDDVDLLHFAGHAEDNPPSMALRDNDRIHPSDLWDTPITRRHPLFFLNGCRASMAHEGLPPSFGGMVNDLLRCEFSGVVAPFLSVDSAAACNAAVAFYDAAKNGATVAEAVRAIRACADSDPAQAATYMSYFAYVSPALRLI